MLVGRKDELARVEAVIQAAREGQAGSLVVRGEPGIGKTALVDAAIDAAGDVRVLRHQGTEDESPLAFAGLHGLLRPVVDRLGCIPGPQAEALAGALAIGPPVHADRFAVGAATLSLLAAAAEADTTVVVIDDAHWLDPDSLASIAFARRRLGDERLAMLFTCRDVPDLGQTLAGPDLRLDGLGRADALALVHSEGTVTPVVAEELSAATAGNPLALIELTRQLDREQLAGRASLPDPLPIGTDLREAFRQQLIHLPEATRAALVVTAIAGSPTPGELLTAVRALGLHDSALDPAEKAGIVKRVAGRIVFRHPLVRATVHDDAPNQMRRDAHALLADVVADPNRAVWHRASAAVLPDREIADALGALAADAEQRGAPADAVAAWQRAAELTPDHAVAVERELAAARAAVIAGTPEHADAILSKVTKESDDPCLLADAALLRGRLLNWGGDVDEARLLMVESAAGVEATDPARAGLLLTHACFAALHAGRVDVAASLLDRIEASQGGEAGDLDRRMRVGVVSAYVRACRGERDLGLSPESVIDLVTSPAARESGIAGLISMPLIWAEHLELADLTATEAEAAARKASAPTLLPPPLTSRAEVAWLSGEWERGLTHATEALELADATGQPNAVARAATLLARFLVGRGGSDEMSAAELLLDRAETIAAQFGLTSVCSFSSTVRGLLHLSMNDPAEAIRPLEGVATHLAEVGVTSPTVVPFRADLVEALARCGRVDEAQEQLAILEGQTRHGSPWATATATRCRVLLAPDTDLDATIAAAVDAGERAGQPFELARTHLTAGERLRRSQRVTDARGHLERARTTFDSLGATRWCERADTELRATGQRRQRPPVASGSVSDLTPQELQIATAVARGASNREVAAQLFLSPKTVEAHLGRVFRKLGVTSRTQLAARFADRL